MFRFFWVVKVFDKLGSATVLVTFGHVVVSRREVSVPRTGPVYRGCPCRDPLGCYRCPGRMASEAGRQPLCGRLQCSVVDVIVFVFHNDLQLRILTSCVTLLGFFRLFFCCCKLSQRGLGC